MSSASGTVRPNRDHRDDVADETALLAKASTAEPSKDQTGEIIPTLLISAQAAHLGACAAAGHPPAAPRALVALWAPLIPNINSG